MAKFSLEECVHGAWQPKPLTHPGKPGEPEHGRTILRFLTDQISTEPGDLDPYRLRTLTGKIVSALDFVRREYDNFAGLAQEGGGI